MPASSVPNIAGEKSAAITGCPSCASGIAIDPAPHPISSTDSPGWSANSLIKSCAYGAVSSGRKCRALLSHSKESSARCRAACKRIHSSFQSTESSSERTKSSATGHPPHNKKAAPPKEKSRNQHISERTVPTPNHRHQPGWAEAKRLPKGQNPTEVPLCGSPAARRQAYKVDREFRTSRRALNVLSVRARTVRAGDLICLPSGSGAPRPNP